MDQIVERPPLAPGGPRETFRLATERCDNAKTAAPAQGQNRAVREARLKLLREAIGEQAGLIQIQADIVQMFASLGDDAGVTYALKRPVAHARAAAQTANELAALKAGGQ
jgi:hypothetical protein